MDSNRDYKTKYFALSFCAAFFAFALMFLFLMSATRSGAPSGAVLGDDSGVEVVELAYQPYAGDALTLLLFGTERAHSVADTFVLLRFDPVRGEVGVAVFPPGTVLNHNEREETLSEIYRFGGAIYTRNALSAFLHIPIDRYARISLSGFITAAAAVGSIEFELDEDITIQDGDLPVTLNAGVHLLDGRQIAAFIRYQSYPGGEAQRGRITSQLVSAVINQRIDVVNSTLIDRIFLTVINLADTDITYSDYERRKDAARLMAALGKEVARPIPLQGEFLEDGAKFILADTALANLTLIFL